MAYSVEYGYASNIPKPLKPYKNVIFPFSDVVWITVLAASLVAIGTFALIHSTYQVSLFSDDYLLATGFSKARRDKVHFSNFLLLPIAMLVNQSFAKEKWLSGSSFRGTLGSRTQGTSLRILYLFWTLFTWVLTMSYLSNFFANLVAVQYERPIDTIKVHLMMMFSSCFVVLFLCIHLTCL